MSESGSESEAAHLDGEDRRDFLSWCAMLTGLIGGYGMFAFDAARYLFPGANNSVALMFVTDLPSIKVGDSMNYRSPAGQNIVITRLGDAGTEQDFIALSSVCPHLGCQVHWESQNDRFFCPCHNGAFDSTGIATEGPPADAKQTLAQYPLKVQKGLLYIEVSTEALA